MTNRWAFVFEVLLLMVIIAEVIMYFSLEGK